MIEFAEDLTLVYVYVHEEKSEQRSQRLVTWCFLENVSHSIRWNCKLSTSRVTSLVQEYLSL